MRARTGPPGTLSLLLGVPDLHDVLALQFPNDPVKRWTYHYRAFEQIDYLLISGPLRRSFREAGVQRGGIYQLEKLTKGGEKEFGTVTYCTNAASDHGVVWAEFDF